MYDYNVGMTKMTTTKKKMTTKKMMLMIAPKNKRANRGPSHVAVLAAAMVESASGRDSVKGEIAVVAGHLSSTVAAAAAAAAALLWDAMRRP
ncbi:hypothetical protein CDD80_6213 [Ophiocordyceps camponoti-rufipedis]|uniref:Uncharacterized protein n=1 Tax=Ophiocordyceps camponoti-rufipedis TaxID=2004952 RepID=A0A2C5YKU5_9HYPO|nr:hypothetical protein CDD80_6213 [Ophiocordyceps camponoti-rufipedis]